MNQEYLELLEKIRDTLEEIQGYQEDMGLDNPAMYLAELEKVRDALEEIQLLQEDNQ